MWEIVSVINTGDGVPGCLQQTSWSAYQGLFIIMEGGNHRDASIVFKSSSSHPPQPSTALHPPATSSQAGENEIFQHNQNPASRLVRFYECQVSLI